VQEPNADTEFYEEQAKAYGAAPGKPGAPAAPILHGPVFFAMLLVLIAYVHKYGFGFLDDLWIPQRIGWVRPDKSGTVIYGLQMAPLIPWILYHEA